MSTTVSFRPVVLLGSCMPVVAIRRFRVANLSQPETRLRSSDTRGAHRYLATLANYYKE
jgi:hypothetical protein